MLCAVLFSAPLLTTSDILLALMRRTAMKEKLECMVSWESQTCSGGKGPQQAFSPNLSSKQGHLWGQTRLLRQLLKISKDGNCTTSLANLFHCWAVLVGKMFYSYSVWTYFKRQHCPSSSHHAPLWRA